MVSCANITLEKIRARISFGTPGGGGSLTFETPDVKSFSVSRNRSALPASFSASIEMPSSVVIPAGEDIIIEAGTAGNLRRIFTGQTLSLTVNPSFENASRYVVNLSGQDRFRDLEGKNISRRQRARSLSQFAAITGVSTRSPQKGVSFEKRAQSGGGIRFVNADTNIREHSKLVRTDTTSFDPYGAAIDPEQIEKAEEEGRDIIDILPKSVSIPPGSSVLLRIENETYEQGDAWSVSDEAVGRVIDRQDGTALYTQLALGENEVIFAKSGTTVFIGKATAVGVVIHDHSSLGQGGPAFGVFGSD